PVPERQCGHQNVRAVALGHAHPAPPGTTRTHRRTLGHAPVPGRRRTGRMVPAPALPCPHRRYRARTHAGTPVRAPERRCGRTQTTKSGFAGRRCRASTLQKPYDAHGTFANVTTLQFLVVGVVLIAAGVVLLLLDRRRRTPRRPGPE